MHLLVLLLIFTVLLADSGLGEEDPSAGSWRWMPLAVAVLPPLIAILVELVLVRRTLHAASSGSMQAILAAGRRLRYLHWILFGSSILAMLVFGLLELVRSLTGDLVVLDELLAVLPCLLLLCVLWLVQWPVERMMRESLVIRRLDHGLPVHPIPTAWEHLLNQVRGNLLVVLVPAAIVLAAVESARLLLPFVLAADAPSWASDLFIGSAAFIALVVSPLGVLVGINAGSMPAGPTREGLEAVLARAGVRVADIRLWPTSGSILNGAVIGFMPRFRYVLLTDALVETLPEAELEAVMAHEVGHLRHRHLPWTAAALVAQVWLYATLFEWVFHWLHPVLVGLGIELVPLMDSVHVIATAIVMLAAFIGFGWISRRFELQADAFAASSLSPEGGIIEPAATGAMAGALESVAQVNGLDPDRRTWRHGSIRWRQGRLHRLIGLPGDRLPIGRVVHGIKLVVAVILVVLGAHALFETPLDAGRPDMDTGARELQPPALSGLPSESEHEPS